MSIKKPNPSDKLIGARIRALRLERGMSQDKLGDGLGLTFQQVQKYEKGTNRIGGSRAMQIAKIFGVPVADLFPPMEGGDTPISNRNKVLDMVDSAGTVRLVAAYNAIAHPDIRAAIVRMAESLAAEKTWLPKRRG